MIDGNNMLILSRTSEDAPNQHDSERLTLHRMPDFRRLTLGTGHPLHSASTGSRRQLPASGPVMTALRAVTGRRSFQGGAMVPGCGWMRG